MVGAVDGDSLRRTHGIPRGHREHAEDVHGLVLRVGREVQGEFGRDVGRPHGARDGRTDGSADADDGEEDGGDGGHILVAGGGLHSQLRRHVEHASADADCDLSPDDLAGRAAFGSVTDHESDPQEVDTSSGGDVVFVVFGVLDDQRNHNGRHGRGE